MDLPKKRVLVVDDDREICALITDILEDEGYSVCPCLTGEAALEILAHEHFHLVLSDIKMPRVSGIELLLHIRRMNLDSQVILMTAYASVHTAIQAVRGAAFDYLVKPFSLSELRQCVVRALEREPGRIGGVVSIDDLVVDMNARHVWLGDKQVDLTRREFDVLAYLISHKGRVVPWEELVEKVWNAEADGRTGGTVRSCIRRLRTRLDDDASNPRYIENIWGVGYRVEGSSLTPPFTA
ncbi:MAG TPA: response regulator transcription factor [Anaerolineae bacterium]|nr:response regulator transcription factor [Anaerolineae bacterium]